MCHSTRTLALTPAIVSHFRLAFEVLDADQDGKIGYDDLCSFCSGFLGGRPEADADIVGTMISVADLDRDGFVEYEEFERILGEARGRPRSSGRPGGGVMEDVFRVMEDVFRVMDQDGDGRLSHGDLKRCMERAGLEASDEDIKAMITLVGGDESDGVSFDGLLKILTVDNIMI